LAKLSNIPEGWTKMILNKLGRKPTELEEKRLGICHECNKGKLTCIVCPCPVEALVSVEEEKCELGKW